MTNLRTAFLVILVQPTCRGDQCAKGFQFQSTYHRCRESHKTQVWLCFLVLSLLSTCTCAASMPSTSHLQTCLNSEKLKNAIERSEAMLYAPPSYEVKENCKIMSLKCYVWELMMVILEEEFILDCIFDFNHTLSTASTVDCPPCESYSLKNITVFQERLKSLLQELSSRGT